MIVLCLHSLGLSGSLIVACAQEGRFLSPEFKQMADPGRIGRLLAPVPPPRRLPAAQLRPAGGGQVRLSISVRSRIAEEPRFVIAFRVAEHEDELPTDFETPEEIVRYFTLNAEQEINDIDRLCPLSDKLRSKLKLAAMGDMSRLTRELRELKGKYAHSFVPNQVDMAAVSNELVEINANLVQNVRRNGSMFSMVLTNVLSPEQSSALVAAQFNQQFDHWGLKLSAEQRGQLLELMVTQSGRLVDPILLWDTPHCVALVHSLDHGQLETFLEPPQLEAIDRLRELPRRLVFR